MGERSKGKEKKNPRKFGTEDNKVVKGIKRYEGGEGAMAAADKKSKSSRRNSLTGSKKERKRKNSSAGKAAPAGGTADVEAPVAAEASSDDENPEGAQP